MEIFFNWMDIVMGRTLLMSFMGVIITDVFIVTKVKESCTHTLIREVNGSEKLDTSWLKCRNVSGTSM